MNIRELTNMLSELCATADIGVRCPQNVPCSSFGLGSTSVVYSGADKVLRLNEIIEKFWTTNDEIYQTYTRNAIQKELISLVRSHLPQGHTITQQVTRDLFSRLLSGRKETWEVFRTIHGASMTQHNPITLGPFKIYQWPMNRTEIMNTYPHAQKIWDILGANLGSKILITVRIDTREPKRALELADVKFHQFQNVVRFMLASPVKQADIGIFDYMGWSVSESIIVSMTRVQSSSQASGAFRPVPIDSPAFTDPQAGYDRIWRLLTLQSHSEMEKRILASIDWIGKAWRDEDPAKSFVQFMFALEALLTFNEKGVLVSPSIASQISEYVAFILGTDLNSRLEYERRIKALYSYRSAVAHGGRQSVSLVQVNEAMYTMKSLVVAFLTDHTLRTLNRMQDLRNWINAKKYFP